MGLLTSLIVGPCLIVELIKGVVLRDARQYLHFESVLVRGNWREEL